MLEKPLREGGDAVTREDDIESRPKDPADAHERGDEHVQGAHASVFDIKDRSPSMDEIKERSPSTES